MGNTQLNRNFSRNIRAISSVLPRFGCSFSHTYRQIPKYSLMIRFVPILLFFFMSFSIYAAGISGYIIDCANNSPLIGVNIKVDGYGYGTISNNEGYFRLAIPDNCKGKKLKISYIGYKSFELQIAELADKAAKKYCMEEIIVALAGITVIPDNTLLSMLTKAYKKIPENYPDFPTRFQGFYREGLKMKDGSFLEFSEAILNGYKTSYSVKTMGQISIEKSRKTIFPGRDTINLVRFYGGPFFPHTYDIVHSRKEFIQPSNFKDYQYQLEEEVIYDGNPAYLIRFYPKNDHVGIAKGKFLIDRETLAYIRFDYQLTERGIKQKMMGFLGPLNQLSSKKSIAYYKYNNKWYINSIQSASEYNNTKSNMLLETTDDYITTSVEFDDVEPIPFEKQLGFTDIFADVATEYSKSFWKDYTILEQGQSDNEANELQYSISDSEQILSKKYKNPKSKRDYVINFIRRFYFDYGVNGYDTKTTVNNYTFNYALSNGSQYQYSGNGRKPSISISYYLLTGYKLSKQWSVYYEEQQSFGSQSYLLKNHSFGISKSICIKQGGQQFFMEPRLAYFRNFQGIDGGKLDNPDKNLKIADRKFNAKKIAFYPGSLEQGIKTGLLVRTRVNKFIYFVIGGNYDLSFTQSPKLYVAEKTGLFKQKAYQSMENSAINYQENSLQIVNPSFNISKWFVFTGFRFSL